MIKSYNTKTCALLTQGSQITRIPRKNSCVNLAGAQLNTTKCQAGHSSGGNQRDGTMCGNGNSGSLFNVSVEERKKIGRPKTHPCFKIFIAKGRMGYIHSGSITLLHWFHRRGLFVCARRGLRYMAVQITSFVVIYWLRNKAWRVGVATIA